MATGSQNVDFGHDGIRGRLSDFVNDHIVLVLLGPPLAIIGGIFIYPVLWMFYQSLFVSVAVGIPPQFAPLENYQNLFSAPQFWKYLRQTLYYSFGSLILAFSWGMIVALALNHVKNNWLRNTYSTLILFSWALPLAVVALMWRFLFHGADFAFFNLVLMDLGLIESPISYISRNVYALPIVTVVDAWIRMPFAMIVFLAGLQSIPDHMYDAAKVDGATTFQMFRNITLPYLRPYMAIVGLIVWMFAFRAFSIIWPMTQGGPGTRTTTLALWIYREGMVKLNFGFGSAIAAFLVMVTIIIATFYVTVVLKRIEE